MKTIILWKGSHTPELISLLKSIWEKSDLLILIPPFYEDFNFIKHLPLNADISLQGDWNKTDRDHLLRFPKNSNTTPLWDEPVLGVFSSGSTQKTRKLVLYSKRNIESSLSAITELFDLDKIENIFCYPQPYHTFGLNLGYLFAILYSKTLISLTGHYTSQFHHEWIKNHSSKMITLGAPAHFLDLLSWCSQNKIKPPSSSYSIIGGARVHPDLWYAQKNLLNINEPSIGYGCTEASPGITHLPPGEPPTEDGEIGYFLKNVTLLDHTSEDGFTFSGPNMCMAYISNDQLIIPDKILVHDRLIRKESGSYVYKCRTDFILNRGGEKFSLEEIEHYLLSSLKIETVCGTTSDKRLGEELTVLYKNKNFSQNDLHKKISDHLFLRFGRRFNSDFFAPLSTIPLNQNGKTDRQKAQALFIQRENNVNIDSNTL